MGGSPLRVTFRGRPARVERLALPLPPGYAGTMPESTFFDFNDLSAEVG